MTQKPLAIVALAILAFAIWTASHAGLSRLYAASAANTRDADAASHAITLSPNDPDAHLLRGLLLKSQNRIADALPEFEKAAALRPRDYVLWMELGLARDEAGDTSGATEAFKQAVANAPSYAASRWQLGNVLLRSGRMDEAFAEMRFATQSNPAYLPQLIDLAWSIYRADVAAVERAIAPKTNAARLVLARYAARHGKPAEAAAMLRGIDNVADDERRSIVKDLLAANHFREAYEIWSSPLQSRKRINGFTDGGFENQIALDETGFGWQVARNIPTVRASIDQAAPHDGKSSLRLDWTGYSNSSSNIVSQIVIVEPKTHYRLSFAVRTEELVTGGPPLIVVLDTSSKDESQLGQSAPFAGKTVPWQESTVEFTTGEETEAVLVVLRRQNCTSGPCPIFGRLWLDDFGLAIR